MKEFNWEESKYPCFGIDLDKTEIVCFSSLKTGHRIDDGFFSNKWNMDNFKPYTPPKEKTKLWYWEHKKENGNWYINTQRFSEGTRDMLSDKTYRKIEALGYIEGD